MNDSVEAPDGYEAAAQHACDMLASLLALNPEARSMDAIALWEHLEHTYWQMAAGIDLGLTIAQWSAALDVARERTGLAPLPRSEIAVIGPMADPNTRAAARVMQDGMFVGSELGTSFHCKCGWVSPRLESANHLGSEISWHLAEAHR